MIFHTNLLGNVSFHILTNFLRICEELLKTFLQTSYLLRNFLQALGTRYNLARTSLNLLQGLYPKKFKT
jgi:hypothetical protein